jgi:outer membrane protein OmpA-like peptidoglycan-associated protein
MRFGQSDTNVHPGVMEGIRLDRTTSLWIAIIGFSLLGATALFSCVPHIQEDISAKALAAAGAEAAPSGWASIQVDGQRLVLSGTPPDAARARLLVRKLARIDGVVEVDDQLSRPTGIGRPEADPDGALSASSVPSLVVDSTSADLTPVAGQGEASNASAADNVTATQPSSPGIEIAAADAVDVAESAPQPTTPAETEKTPPAVDPIIQAAEAGPGRPLLSEPLARCQREIDALLTGSASFFTSASSDITADALPVVDQVAALLAQCNARAEIAGHTDNSGRTRPNQLLSQARADAIRAHLIVKGVPETQVSAIGFGEERPIVSNRTPEGRRQNRRIEVRIVDGQTSIPSTALTGNRS